METYRALERVNFVVKLVAPRSGIFPVQGLSIETGGRTLPAFDRIRHIVELIETKNLQHQPPHLHCYLAFASERLILVTTASH